MNDEKIPVMIVEDDAGARKTLALYLSEIPGIEVIAIFGSSEEALPGILSENPRLLFLDVELPGKSGIELLEDLRNRDLDFNVIFTTAYDHYAIKAIKNAAFDYLLKPVDKDELNTTLTRFRAKSRENNFRDKIDLLINRINPVGKIRFNSRNGFVMIDPSDIIWCEADWNYTNIHYGVDEKETVTMVLARVEELLSSGSFFRINRSILINLNWLIRVSRKHHTCTLKAGTLELDFHIPSRHIRELEEKLDRS